MKKVVKCLKCANAAIKLGFGFVQPDEIYCTERSGTVNEEDGITTAINPPHAHAYEGLTVLRTFPHHWAPYLDLSKTFQLGMVALEHV